MCHRDGSLTRFAGRNAENHRVSFRALLALSLLLPLTAWAHAVLVESTPQDGTAISGHSVPVLLSFNSRIDQARSTLRLEHSENATGISLKG
jgi:methionine-rich copper-binding protein CopC